MVTKFEEGRLLQPAPWSIEGEARAVDPCLPAVALATSTPKGCAPPCDCLALPRTTNGEERSAPCRQAGRHLFLAQAGCCLGVEVQQVEDAGQRCGRGVMPRKQQRQHQVSQLVPAGQAQRSMAQHDVAWSGGSIGAAPLQGSSQEATCLPACPARTWLCAQLLACSVSCPARRGWRAAGPVRCAACAPQARRRRQGYRRRGQPRPLARLRPFRPAHPCPEPPTGPGWH